MEKIEICNAALIEAHQDSTITNINESSVDAERCRRIYDTTRRELLSMYQWNFSTKYVKLARVSESVEGFKFAYKYPTEALRIHDIYINEEDFKARVFTPFEYSDSQIAYLDGEKVILCNYEQPFISESVDIEDESIFPESFCRLFYLFMALKISKMAGSDSGVREEINASISSELSIAMTISNRENQLPKEEKNYYVDVRA